MRLGDPLQLPETGGGVLVPTSLYRRVNARRIPLRVVALSVSAIIIVIALRGRKGAA